MDGNPDSYLIWANEQLHESLREDNLQCDDLTRDFGKHNDVSAKWSLQQNCFENIRLRFPVIRLLCGHLNTGVNDPFQWRFRSFFGI